MNKGAKRRRMSKKEHEREIELIMSKEEGIAAGDSVGGGMDHSDGCTGSPSAPRVANTTYGTRGERSKRGGMWRRSKGAWKGSKRGGAWAWRT